MHGLAQGAIQGITGGSFKQNFLTAAISRLAGSAYGTAFKEFANKGVGQVLFSTVAGGTTAAMQGGNFWQGAGMGFTIGLLNHAMHEMDPPGKKKSITQSLKDNPDKISEAAEAGLSLKQLRMIDAREGLSVKDKIGTFGKFSTKYARYSRVGNVLGKINTAATIYNTGSDIYDYSNGDLSGARLSYRLGSTAASIGTAAAVGSATATPGIGTLAGFLVGVGSSVGEFIYDGWNTSVMPVINQGTYQINNNQAWTNFHP